MAFALCLQALLALGLVRFAAANPLRGEGFSPPKVDAWEKESQFKGIVEHVLAKVPLGDVSRAIVEFDNVCDTQRLGMNLGKPKGVIIENTLRKSLAFHGAGKPLTVLELGAHFGDGTLRIVRPLVEQPPAEAAAKHVVISVEGDPKWASGCARVVSHALGDSAAVRHVALYSREKSMVNAAQTALKHAGAQSFDVVFLDHEHGRYLEDLRELLKRGLLKVGSLVHADNAGRDARVLGKYLQFVRSGGPGNFHTDLEAVTVPYADKVAVSEYIGAAQEL